MHLWSHAYYASLWGRRPVSSSELLEKPSLTSKEAPEYCLGREETRGISTCNKWLEADVPSFCMITVNGEHGFGKTQLLMQARALLEPRCRVLHVRCRAHERGQRGKLSQRLLAQLCGFDVWPSMQHIIPMLSTSPAAKYERVSRPARTQDSGLSR